MAIFFWFFGADLKAIHVSISALAMLFSVVPT